MKFNRVKTRALRNGSLLASLLLPAAFCIAQEPVRLALLIGVEKYAHLGTSEQLDGAANDVALVKETLISRFGFSAQNVQTLVDDQATSAEIRAQFRQLASKVRSLPKSDVPAQVVIHYSGHGSQVADQPVGDANRDEADGLDETLVPHDASKQGGDEDIRDDELYRMVDELCADRRAKLFVVLDCCHSGTGARGGTKIRKLARDLALAKDVTNSSDLPATQRKLPVGAVILSACRAVEVEPEYQRDGKSFGLLSRFLVQVLNEQPQVSELSYAALREAIAARYRQDPTVSQPPEPQIEGDATSLESAVLSSTLANDRDPWWLVISSNAEGTKAILHAGSFHGVTVGSRYQIFASPDQIPGADEKGTQGKATAGGVWLKIENVEAASSSGNIFRWEEDREIDASLGREFKQGFAVERYRGDGGYRLAVQVVRAESADTDSAAVTAAANDLPAAIRSAMADQQSKAWLDWVDESVAPDVLIRWDRDYAAVFPFTSGSPVSSHVTRELATIPATLAGGWGPLDLRQPDCDVRLIKLLRQITRARNLLRVAALGQTGQSSDIQVKVELMKIDVDNSATITRAVPWTTNGDGDLTMPEGSLYTVRVTNLAKSGEPVFVTVLVVDADMGIDHAIPYQLGSSAVDEQRLLPGESRLSGPFQCAGDDGGAAVAGPRTAIVLATREENDFYRLSQPTLSKARSRESSASSLGEILMQQTYFQSRGNARLRPRKLFDGSWTASTLTWRVIP